jgi:hypothetical protein
MAKKLTIGDTELDTWFERDRSHVNLKRKDTGETIIEWWDDAVGEAVEDGFLNARDYHGSAFEYAESMGLTDGKRRSGVSIHVADDDDEDDDDFDDEDDEDDENEDGDRL